MNNTEQYVLMRLSIDHGQTYLMSEMGIFSSLEEAKAYRSEHDDEYEDEGHAWTGRTEYEIVKKVGDKYYDLNGKDYHGSDYFYGHLGQINPHVQKEHPDK